MTTHVPRVSSEATVLDATNVMRQSKSSGVVVFEGERAVGLVTDRRLLEAFFPLDRKPDEVKVSQVMAPPLENRPRRNHQGSGEEDR